MPGRDDSVIVADALSQVVVGSGLVAAVERLGLLVFTYPEDDHVFSFRIFCRRQSTVVASSYRRHDPTRPDPTRPDPTQRDTLVSAHRRCELGITVRQFAVCPVKSASSTKAGRMSVRADVIILPLTLLLVSGTIMVCRTLIVITGDQAYAEVLSTNLWRAPCIPVILAYWLLLSANSA